MRKPGGGDDSALPDREMVAGFSTKPLQGDVLVIHRKTMQGFNKKNSNAQGVTQVGSTTV